MLHFTWAFGVALAPARIFPCMNVFTVMVLLCLLVLSILPCFTRVMSSVQGGDLLGGNVMSEMFEKIPVWCTVQDNCTVTEQVDDSVCNGWRRCTVTELRFEEIR